MENKNLKNIKQSGFKVPKDYFENLEESLLNSSEINIDIKESGFKVPDNYFDKVETSILNKTSNKTKETRVISLYNKKTLITSLSIAATILLLLNLSIFDKQITFDSIDNAALETFVLNEELESLDIARLISNDNELSNSLLPDSVSDTYLESYLLDSEDIEDIISD